MLVLTLLITTFVVVKIYLYVDDPSLGFWVATQRRNYRRIVNDDSAAAAGLTPERIQKLEEIGFEWNTTGKVYILFVYIHFLLWLKVI